MTEQSYNFFVAAAVVAAELDKASKIAKQLSITASNARAVALRAGEGAAGFRPLTDFIDRLANLTVTSSKNINHLAGILSRTAADKYRADHALSRFDKVFQQGKAIRFIETLEHSYQRTKNEQQQLGKNYQLQQHKLLIELETLKDELRTAVILATLSRVEASQAGLAYQEALNNVAGNVESAAKEIKTHIQTSIVLVASQQQEQ